MVSCNKDDRQSNYSMEMVFSGKKVPTEERGSGVLSDISCHKGRGLKHKECHNCILQSDISCHKGRGLKHKECHNCILQTRDRDSSFLMTYSTQCLVIDLGHFTVVGKILFAVSAASAESLIFPLNRCLLCSFC